MTTLNPFSNALPLDALIPGARAPGINQGTAEGVPSDIDAAISREREQTAARAVSPYTTGEKVKRVLWSVVEKTAFRWSFHNHYGVRNTLLRAFGADVHPTARVRASVHVEIPWNLTLCEGTIVGDNATLYCLGKVTVGAFVTISQNAHICAGTHDYTRPDFPLRRVPVTIEKHAWIAADAFVGPNVTVGEGAVLGARAVAMRDLEAWGVYAGNPAQLVKRRRFTAA